MPTSKRKMNRKRWKQPKIIGKRSNNRLGSISSHTYTQIGECTQPSNLFPCLSSLLNSVLIFYKTHPSRPSILAKIQAKKQVNSPSFYSYAPLCLSTFKKTTCILHHFAFLDGCRFAIFSTPISHSQPQRLHFFVCFLPPLSDVLKVQSGFAYTISVHIYAYLPFIQQHNALRLAPKRLAFSTKMHCVQRQNTLHLAPKRTVFSTKTRLTQQQIAPNLVPIAVLYNVHSFCLHLQLPPFYIKTNLRENPFFAVEWAIGGEKCSYNVKICTKNITNQIENKGAREQGDKLTRKRVNKLMGAAIFSPLLVDKVTSNKVTSLHGVSHLFTIIS